MRVINKKHYLVVGLLLAVIGLVFVADGYNTSFFVERENESPTTKTPEALEPKPQLPQLTVIDDDSILRLINAEYRLPDDYTPPNLVLPDVSLGSQNPDAELRLRAEAARALEAMFATAKTEANLDLQLASGYRPYSTQAAIYSSAGGSNQSLVAVPGGSEHQSGLGADIKRQDFVCRLEECFGNQPEGVWTAANAHRFGYVLRYPEGKEDKTGISYKAWHFRYVGKDLAEILHEENLVLEEYYQRQVQ